MKVESDLSRVDLERGLGVDAEELPIDHFYRIILDQFMNDDTISPSRYKGPILALLERTMERYYKLGLVDGLGVGLGRKLSNRSTIEAYAETGNMIVDLREGVTK